MASSDIEKLSNVGLYDAYFYIPVTVNVPNIADGTSFKVPFWHRYTLKTWTFDPATRELKLRIAVTDDGPDENILAKNNINIVENQAPEKATNPYLPSVRSDGGYVKEFVAAPMVMPDAPSMLSVDSHGKAGASNQGNYSLALKSGGAVVDNGSNFNTPTNQKVAPPQADLGVSAILGAIAAIVGLSVVYLILTKVEDVVESPPFTGLVLIGAAIIGLILYREYRKSG